MIVLQQVRSPVPEDIKRLKLALAGFRSTKTRHDGARAARDLETSYASCSSHHLDDRARRSARSVLRAVLQDRTGQNRFGMVVPGVRWARTDMPTTTSHLGQGSNPVLWRREGIISLSVGMRWRKVSELPPPTRGIPIPRGSDVPRPYGGPKHRQDLGCMRPLVHRTGEVPELPAVVMTRSAIVSCVLFAAVRARVPSQKRGGSSSAA